jgi:hypothetical protein
MCNCVCSCRLLDIQIIFLIFGIVMGLFAIMLLTFGFLSTGLTRQHVYSGIRCIIGGRVSAIFVRNYFCHECCYSFKFVSVYCAVRSSIILMPFALLVLLNYSRVEVN